jgi:hypothetical protein
MRRTLVLVTILLSIVSCTKESPVPSGSGEALRKKNTQSTPLQVVNMPQSDWNIVGDTTYCGSLVLRWSKQQKPSWESYVIIPTPIIPSPTLCAGGLNTKDTVLYYQYGWGCSFSPSKSYSVRITYSVKDSAQGKVFVYTSMPDTITTGRGLWQCN